MGGQVLRVREDWLGAFHAGRTCTWCYLLSRVPPSPPRWRSRGLDLPWVKEGILEKFRCCIDWLVGEIEKGETKKQEKRGRRKLKEFELKAAKVKQTAALLAVLGWQRGEVENTMTDIFRVRRVIIGKKIWRKRNILTN